MALCVACGFFARFTCVASEVARCVRAVVARLAGFSQDCSVLVSVVAVLPQGLRYAVDLAGAFWRYISH
ncbi:hypothetical protein Taro_038420 [Colocasia esculenta]|uniref:Secreted protein n=1 Tax=Colocasia esculenta TaxID=4460 RepID=A0A843W852_COLES|nr:hypothetical protein [Colocasia esculenta]